MLLAVSVITMRLDLVRRNWRHAGLPPVPGQTVNNAFTTRTMFDPDLPTQWLNGDIRLLPPEQIGPVSARSTQLRGCFVVYDWTTKTTCMRFDWDEMLQSPTGFAVAGDRLYVCDGEAASVFEVASSDGRLLRRISHAYMNDLHGIDRTSRGLLLAASGTDVVLEVSHDGTLLYAWWAADAGWDTSPTGHRRPAAPGEEHRTMRYQTLFQATHLNCAKMRDPSERFMLVLLFHQGLLVQVDRERNSADVVLDGLVRPHGLKRIARGWSLVNSARGEVLLLDEHLHVVSSLHVCEGWLQDATVLNSGAVLGIDSDRHRLVEIGVDGTPVASLEFDERWRPFELETMPDKLTITEF